MKIIQKRWLPIFLVVAVGFLFSACENNADEPVVRPGGTDTEGLITLHMRNYNNGQTYIYLNGKPFYINNANNFTSGYNIDFCDVGTKQLSDIKKIPTIGWAQEVAVLPNHSYVVRNNYDQPYTYMKLYVIDYIGGTENGIIGADVQYCEWHPSAGKDDDQPTVPFTISPTILEMSAGETVNLFASADATWTSSNTRVVQIYGSGSQVTVYAVGSGNAIITATASDGTTQTCTVIVY